MDSDKLFYDLTAQQYADKWYSNDMMLPSIREYLALFGNKPRILDLGCGPGNESMRLANEGAEVAGIDYSENCICIARERNIDIPFYCMDFMEIDASLGMFDGIFSCSSLIHMDEADMKTVLGRISAVLKKNGYFLIIYRTGVGQILQYPEIGGNKIQRTIRLYSREKIISIFGEKNYSYVQDGAMDESIRAYWNSLIFRKD